MENELITININTSIDKIIIELLKIENYNMTFKGEQELIYFLCWLEDNTDILWENGRKPTEYECLFGVSYLCICNGNLKISRLNNVKLEIPFNYNIFKQNPMVYME